MKSVTNVDCFDAENLVYHWCLKLPYIKNKDLAELLDLSLSKVSKIKANLIELGFLKVRNFVKGKRISMEKCLVTYKDMEYLGKKLNISCYSFCLMSGVAFIDVVNFVEGENLDIKLFKDSELNSVVAKLYIGVYQEGLDLDDVRAKYFMSYQYVDSANSKYGLGFVGLKSKNKLKRKRINNIEKYVESSCDCVSLEMVSKATDMSYYLINSLLGSLRKDIRKKIVSNQEFKKREKILKIRELILEEPELTISELAEGLGMSYEVVRAYIHEYSLPYKKKNNYNES